MAVYEYECEQCQKVHEVTQKMTDAPLKTCPQCTGPVTKLISRSSFALKGAGFYTNDYKRAGQKTESTQTAPACAPTGCAKPECK